MESNKLHISSSSKSMMTFLQHLLLSSMVDHVVYAEQARMPELHRGWRFSVEQLTPLDRFSLSLRVFDTQTHKCIHQIQLARLQIRMVKCWHHSEETYCPFALDAVLCETPCMLN